MLRGGQRRRQVPPGIGEKAQRAAGGDGRIKLAQRPGSRIAGVGENLVTGRRLPCVQRREIGVGHVDFAAYLQHLGRPGQALRDIGNRAGVFGDILAHLAVTPGGSLHQNAAFIAQGQRQAVDLRLGRVEESTGMPKELADAVIELGHVLVRKGVFQRKHRARVPDFAKAIGHGGPDLIAGRIAALQPGKPRLDRRIAPLQRVIGGIRHFGRVQPVIGRVRCCQHGCKPRKLILRIGLCQCPDRLFRHAHPLSKPRQG